MGLSESQRLAVAAAQRAAERQVGFSGRRVLVNVEKLRAMPTGSPSDPNAGWHEAGSASGALRVLEMFGLLESDPRLFVDWQGLALELEVQAKRVESKSAMRAMYAAARGLRLLGEGSGVIPANCPQNPANIEGG